MSAHFSTIATDFSGDRRTGYHGGGGRIGFDFDEFSEKVATEAARMAISQLGAVDAPAGPQTVVPAPWLSGVLLHEAVGHGLADFIHKAIPSMPGSSRKGVSELLSHR